MHPLSRKLTEGLELLSLDLSEHQQTQLLAFVDLLVKWNKAYNLTAIRAPLDMLERHILESLSVAPFLTGKRLLDVGTGPGLPGIPLAIACPEKEFCLLDSNGKKTRFITQTVIELGLSNVEVVHKRIEDFRPELGFDQIMSRAFADIATTVDLLAHLWLPETSLLLMKGPRVDTELESLDLLVNLKQYKMPSTHEGDQRLLIELKHIQEG